MTQETKPKKAVEFYTGFCKHGEDDYSLSIEFEDCHATMNTYNYDHRVGYRVGLTIFDLSTDDIVNLANTILEQAFAIRQSEKKTETKER